MHTSLQGIAEKAKSQEKYRFRNLYGMLDEALFRDGWRDIRTDAAYGVDEVSAQAYEQDLDENIDNLVERLKRKSYRTKLVRRDAPSSSRYTPSTTCFQYRHRAMRVSSRRATSQHRLSVRFSVISFHVCCMIHLPPLLLNAPQLSRKVDRRSRPRLMLESQREWSGA